MNKSSRPSPLNPEPVTEDSSSDYEMPELQLAEPFMGQIEGTNLIHVFNIYISVACISLYLYVSFNYYY